MMTVTVFASFLHRFSLEIEPSHIKNLSFSVRSSKKEKTALENEILSLKTQLLAAHEERAILEDRVDDQGNQIKKMSLDNKTLENKVGVLENDINTEENVPRDLLGGKCR